MAKFSTRRVRAFAAAGAMAVLLPLIASCATTPDSSAGGWVAKGDLFTFVSHSFRVPSVTCDGTNRQVLFDAGYDLVGASTVEKAGLQIDCAAAGAVPKYSGFYEATGNPHQTVQLTGSGGGAWPIRPGSYFLVQLLSFPPGANAATSPRGVAWHLSDSTVPNGSSSVTGTAGKTFPTTFPGTSSRQAGCLVESERAAMPHFGAIKVGPCNVATGGFGTPLSGWDVTGTIRALAPGQPNPAFTDTGYKMVNSNGGVRVGVTSQNSDGTYSLIQLTP